MVREKKNERKVFVVVVTKRHSDSSKIRRNSANQDVGKVKDVRLTIFQSDRQKRSIEKREGTIRDITSASGKAEAFPPTGALSLVRFAAFPRGMEKRPGQHPQRGSLTS
jgi:hypothetical protein